MARCQDKRMVAAAAHEEIIEGGALPTRVVRGHSLVRARSEISSDKPLASASLPSLATAASASPTRTHAEEQEEGSRAQDEQSDAEAAAVEIVVAQYSKSLSWLNGHLRRLHNDLLQSEGSASPLSSSSSSSSSSSARIDVYVYMKGGGEVDSEAAAAAAAAASSSAANVDATGGAAFVAAGERAALMERLGLLGEGSYSSSSSSSSRSSGGNGGGVRFQLARLPNTGREFHTYAHHIRHSLCLRFGCGSPGQSSSSSPSSSSQSLSSSSSSSSSSSAASAASVRYYRGGGPGVLVFIKDSAMKEGGFNEGHHWIVTLHFQKMVRTAKVTGVSDMTGRPGGLSLHSTHLNAHWSVRS